MEALIVRICETVEDAPDYVKNGEGFEHAKLKAAIIVRNGTEEGDDTIDLQFEDLHGNKFIAMTTGKILRNIAGLTK